MTRRAYPILGRRKLRLFDATEHASKPVYLKKEILRGRSWDQSGRSEGGLWTLDLALDLTLDLYLILDPGSQYLRS